MSADGYKYSKQLLDSLKDLDAFENNISHTPIDPAFNNPIERLTNTLQQLKDAEQDAFTEYAQYKAYNDNVAGRAKRLQSLQNDTNLAFQKHLQQTNIDSLKALTSTVQELEKKSSEYAHYSEPAASDTQELAPIQPSTQAPAQAEAQQTTATQNMSEQHLAREDAPQTPPYLQEDETI